MSTNLTNQKIKDTFDQLLHIDGGPEAAAKHVYSGTGVQTALRVGTDRIGVGAIVIGGNFITTSAPGEDIVLLPAGDGALFLSNVVFTDVSEARAALLLGNLSVQNSNNVSITGGSISGVVFTGSFTGITLIESQSFQTVNGGNGLNLENTSLVAEGVSADIDISITPKGTGEVNITKADIDGGAIDGTVIGGSTPAAMTGTVVRSTSTLGYTTGAGGTVTQLTSKATPVTINKLSGRVTTHNAELARDTTVNFVVNNSLVTEDDVVIACVHSGATLGVYELDVDAVANGSFTLALRNHQASSNYSEAVAINFVVIKGAMA